MRINCFEKIKHKEVQQLQAEFNSRVGEDTDLSEQEQKEIGKEIVMRYYRELNNKINALKQDINPNAALSEITDTSIEKKSMEDLYDGLIQKENEGIEQVKKEENEKSKFQNQSPADQIQIIKAAELEATTAINSNNPEAAAAAIEKLDYITKSTPEQIARDAGQKEVDGTIIKRQDSINAVKGKPVNILFSKDKTQEGNYAVIELDDLQPSHKNGIKNDLHFIPEAQPRDRGALEVLKNEAKKKADSLDPAQLADNNIAYFGTPIINARGEIIQGNGRGEAVDYYYHNNQADSKGYRKMVQDKAKELVMDEAAVAKMKYPVLVRMVDVNDEEAIRLGNFTSSDLEDVKQKGAEAKAAIGKLKAADMQQLSDTIGSKVGENDTLKSAIRDNAKSIIDLLMDLGVLRTDNREQYFNQDGVTPEGIEAAHSIVKQLLFEGGANDLQGKFDNLPFAQREAIEKTIPAILTNPELKSHIQKAIEIIHDKIESGTPQFSTWAKQYDMFKGKSPMDIYEKVDLALAKKIDEAKTQKEIASTIKELAVAMNGKPGDLFSDAQEGISFNDAMAENNILFSISEPTTEEVEDMKDIIAELVDDGTLRLSEIQDYVAKELEDNSPELRDLVATAYHEYGKDKENTPIEVTGGVIGRIGKFLSNLFGGTAGEKIFIAKDGESLKLKAEQLTGVKIMLTPDGSILGFTHDGKIYLDGSRMNINTSLHESSHLWTEWVEKNNSDVYNRGVQLIVGSQYLNKVQDNKFYQQEANKLPQNERAKYYQHEALAMAIGDRGAQFVTEAKKSGFKEWLKNLWDTIAKAVGFKDVTADELSSMTLDEFSKRAAAEILKGEQLQAQEKQQQEEANESADDFIRNYTIPLAERAAPNASLMTDLAAGYSNDILEQDDMVDSLELDAAVSSLNELVKVAKERFGEYVLDYSKGLIDAYKNMKDDLTKLGVMVQLKNDLDNERKLLDNSIQELNRNNPDDSQISILKNQREQVIKQLRVAADYVDKQGGYASKKLNILRLTKKLRGVAVASKSKKSIVGKDVDEAATDIEDVLDAPIDNDVVENDDVPVEDIEFKTKQQGMRKKASGEFIKKAKSSVERLKNAKNKLSNLGKEFQKIVDAAKKLC